MSTTISYFDKATDNKPKSIDLDEWLYKTIDPPEDLLFKVENYRKSRNKSLKASLPCVTVSASFKRKRNLKNIKKKNPFIVLDIDRYAKNKVSACNMCLDFDLVKDLFKQIPSCYYVGYSVSSDGKKYKDGMYAIIKLHKKTELIQAFKFFKKKLKRIGINIDNSCKDYTRLRFFSYDPNAYYNPSAKSFKVPEKRKIKAKGNSNVSIDNTKKVETVIELIEANQIDITANYDNWIKVGGSLAGYFGESGRAYFHRVSRFYSDYDHRKCDKKFDSCLKIKKMSLSSFFYVANYHGIRY